MYISVYIIDHLVEDFNLDKKIVFPKILNWEGTFMLYSYQVYINQ